MSALVAKLVGAWFVATVVSGVTMLVLALLAESAEEVAHRIACQRRRRTVTSRPADGERGDAARKGGRS